MPKKLPSYRHHKATGQGYTEHQRKAYYFGPYGTPESKVKYSRFIAELTALQKGASVQPAPGSSILVSELVDAFTDHAARKYVKNGLPTSELNNFKVALLPVVEIYGDVRPDEFGPVALETIRQRWIAQGLARKTINSYVRRVTRAWKWGVSQQIVPIAAWQALTSLEALRAGQGIDHPKVSPAIEGRINAVRPFLSRQLRAMVDFQLWTGCRPHEACQIRTGDINRFGDVWEYRPGSFKTQHHANSSRVVYIGPHAQEIVKPWLRKNLSEPLWQPREARQEWLAAHGNAAVPVGKFQAGYQYNAMSYGRAIERACEKAFGCPVHLRRQYTPRKADDADQIKKDAADWREANCWSPNQLRHTAATRIREAYGIEIARIILGHTNSFTTEIYAEQDRAKALLAVREMG